jgi:surface carbohydrate biosynthesis protein
MHFFSKKNYKMINFFKKIFLLFSNKYIFCVPDKKYFCIYDDNNIFLHNYFSKEKTEFIRHGKINIFIIFVIIFKNGIYIRDFMLNYLTHYIKFVQPEIFISNIDNNPLFWSIKKNIPNIKIIIIQNGLRLKKYDIFEKIKNKKEYKCDLFFTFNKHIASEYANYINSKFIVTGSMENNFRKIKKFKDSKTILFLSEYIGDQSAIFFISNKISFNSWYKPEFNLLIFLKNFCLKNNYKLKVSPRTNMLRQEYLFYKNILGEDNWEFLDKKVSSYDEIDRAKIVISISSTIGYEALARGKKVAFFSCRKMREESGNFGWPAIKRNKGLFWTNNLNIHEFKKILVKLLLMNNVIWNVKSKKIINNLIVYDKNNSIFKKEISNIIH